MFNFFKKKIQEMPSLKTEVLFAELIYDLLKMIDDEKVTKEEVSEIRKKAYRILIDCGFDDVEKIQQKKKTIQ